MTSPYQFYQFWINTEDADVGRYLRMFTFMTKAEIEALEAAHATAPHERAAQRALATAMTTLLHGADASRVATEVSRVIFDKKIDAGAIGDEVYSTLAAEIPICEVLRRGGTQCARCA